MFLVQLPYKIILVIVVGLCLISCADPPPPDAIVGSWKLVKKKKNDSVPGLTPCELRSRIIVDDISEITFNTFNKDTLNNCVEQDLSFPMSKWGQIYYRYYTGSLIAQERYIRVKNDTLFHHFEGWEITDDGIIVHRNIWSFTQNNE